MVDLNVYASLGDNSKKKSIVDSPWAHLISENICANNNLLGLSINRVKICGRMCGKKTVFLRTARTLNELPEFWMIIDILLFDNGKIYLVMEHLQTLCYAYDHFSFVVDIQHQQSQIKSLINLNPCNDGVLTNLKFSVPLQCFNLNKQFHVVPNYYHML